MTQKITTVIGGGVMLSGLMAVALYAQTAAQPARSVTDPGVVTTRQMITPAGVQSVFDGRVYGITFGATAEDVWVLANTKSGPSLYNLDWRDNRVKNRWPLQGTAALQGLAFDASRNAPLVGITIPARAAGNRTGGAVQLLRPDGKTIASGCFHQRGKWKSIEKCFDQCFSFVAGRRG